MVDNVLPRAGQIYLMPEGQTGPLPLLNLGAQPSSLPATGVQR